MLDVSGYPHKDESADIEREVGSTTIMKLPAEPEGKSPLLIYDAECRLCVSSKKWIERWDKKRQIRFLPFQSDEAKKMAPEIVSLECLDAMRLVNTKGVILSGVDAFRGMLPFLPMGGLIGLFFRLPLVPQFAILLYRIIAQNRYHWFGAAQK